MVKMLQNKQEFLQKCHSLGLPTKHDLIPFGMESDEIDNISDDQGKLHAANVISKNGKPLLIQVIPVMEFS